MKKLFLRFLFLAALPLFAREIPILNPNDPSFTWMDDLIDRDFSEIKQIAPEDFEKAYQIYTYGWIAFFQVKENQVSGPEGACKHMLEWLCKSYGLPDLAFWYWNHDGLDGTYSESCSMPVFAGARSKGIRHSILFVDWYFDISNPEGDWNTQLALIDHVASIPWSQKREKLFWRGAATDIWSNGLYSTDNWFLHPRGIACCLSKQHPDLIDAAFTYFPIWTCSSSVEELTKATPMSSLTSLEQHLHFKYQLQITGRMANFPRDRWQFYSNCVVFRHEPPHEMFWYSLLHPWEHYIPIATDLSDLIDKINWAKNHNAQCENIAKSARLFAETHFMPEHIALYCYKALLKYASLF